MSTIDSDDLETTGYFLPEDTWLRLTKLREHVEFLANLARPRQSDEGKEWYAEIRPSEVAICLELLEEQIAQVLEELSWPAERGGRVMAPKADAETEADTLVAEATEPDVAELGAAGPVRDEPGNRLLVGVTLNQIDEINLLLDSLRAHGNVVTCSDHAELSDFTLSIMGDAITRDTQKLRDIMSDVNGQELKPPYGTKPGVREERAIYLAPPAFQTSSGASYAARQHPTYQ
ncbi:XAC0095 family protein [Rhodanobacter soli]